MATTIRKSGALAVRQLDTLTIGGTIEAGDLFRVTVGAKTFVHPAVSTSTSGLATELAAALAGISSADYPEFSSIEFAPSGSTVLATSTEAGKAFTLSVTTTESNGSAADAQTFTSTTTTANAGPHDWGGTGNWSGGVPANGDDVVLENSDESIWYGLAQSAVTLSSLTIRASFTGQVGNAQWHGDGHPEYRAIYLAIGASVVSIGEGEGNGSGLLRLNQGSAQTAVTVYNTGSSSETDAPALCWKGTHASNVMDVFDGSVGVAYFGGETATLDVLRVVAGTVECGAGATLDLVELAGGGTITLHGGATTLTMQHGAGTVWLDGAGNLTTANVWDGTLIVRRAMTITTLNLRGRLDLSAAGAVTITNCNVQRGAEIHDPNGRATFTNGIMLAGCTLADVTLSLGANRTITPS